MFEGKHCTYADYQRLVGESESFLRELGASGEFDAEKHRKTDRFLDFIFAYEDRTPDKSGKRPQEIEFQHG